MEITPVIEIRDASKCFGAVKAIDGASIKVLPGTVHAVIGENGAGKSTLMKLAYGQVASDSGEIFIKGVQVGQKHSPARSIQQGVGMVHQHFMLVGPLTVAENLCLGHEPIKYGLLDIQAVEEACKKLEDKMPLRMRLEQSVDSLSVGEKQRVEIARVLLQECDVLILDEPTAVLSPMEVDELFASIRDLVAQGTSVILITHKIDEILELANDVTVMRQGKVVDRFHLRDGSGPLLGDINAGAIANAIVGKEAPRPIEKSDRKPAEEVARVEFLSADNDLGRRALNEVSFSVHAGEIVGIAGVQGNGQTELCECLAGIRKASQGTMLFKKESFAELSVGERQAIGIGHVSEDRHERSLLLESSVRENVLLSRQRDFRRGPFVHNDALELKARDLVESSDVRPKNIEATMRALSGGNQQKVVIARELDRPHLEFLICAQPTRGVDIGAIDLIHRRLLKARDRGVAILLVSSEISELRTLADRVLVFYSGRIVAECGSDELKTSEGLKRLGAAMTGAT